MQSWGSKAWCKDLDPKIFFNPAREEEAKDICAVCEVEDVCLNDNLYVQFGVSGRMNPAERKDEVARRGMVARREEDDAAENDALVAVLAQP